MQAVQLPLWIEYVKALGTPLVALVAASIASLIAYRQWNTAREKLKLDMFDRRMEIYTCALAVIHWMASYKPDKDSEPVFQLQTLNAKVRWLLSEEISEFLRNLAYRALVSEIPFDEEQFGMSDDDHKLMVENEGKMRREIIRVDLAKLNELFQPYLSVKH